MIIKSALFCFLFSFCALQLQAQEEPAAPEKKKQDTLKVSGEKKKSGVYEPTKDPKKAMLLSAIIPSAGQFYNEKYWKMPLAVGGIVAAIYSAQYNRGEYIRYRDAYRLETDDDPTTQSEFADQNITPQGIRDHRDSYKQMMELSYALSGLAYLLQLVDAYVDAHLFDFNVSDDLSARIEPQVMSGAPHLNSMGIRLTLNFNQKYKQQFHYANSHNRVR